MRATVTGGAAESRPITQRGGGEGGSVLCVGGGSVLCVGEGGSVLCGGREGVVCAGGGRCGVMWVCVGERGSDREGEVGVGRGASVHSIPHIHHQYT